MPGFDDPLVYLQGPGGQDIVAIQKNDVLAHGERSAQIAVFIGALVFIRAADAYRMGVLRNDFLGSVGRAVVGDDYFLRRARLGDCGFDRGGNVFALVITGYDDAEPDVWHCTALYMLHWKVWRSF